MTKPKKSFFEKVLEDAETIKMQGIMKKTNDLLHDTSVDIKIKRTYYATGGLLHQT
jgi:hypothetical protein